MIASALPATEQVSIGFPFALSIIVLFIVTLMFNPEYLIDKLVFLFSSNKKKKESEEDDGMPAWKSGLIHYAIGGFVIPNLFALFLLFFTKNLYIKFIVAVLHFFGFNIDVSQLYLYGPETSIVLYILTLLFTYVGIWLGVIFSILFLQFFPVGNKQKLMKWAMIYMFIMIIFLYYLHGRNRTQRYSYFDFNFFDHLIRLTLFYAISNKYFYTLAKELEALYSKARGY